MGCIADDNVVRCCEFLHSGCEVWRFTDDVDRFGRSFVRDMPNDNKSCINAEADANFYAEGGVEIWVECLHSGNDAECGSYGAVCSVFMCDWIPEIDEDAVSEVSRDVSVLC